MLRPAAILCTAALALASCASKPDNAVSPQPATPPAGEWVVRAIDGVRIDADRRPTITFAQDGAVSGFAGVNRFSGQLKPPGEGFGFGPLASTKMAGPAEAMNLETSFFRAVERVRGFTYSSNDLVLTGDAGAEALRLSRP